MDINSSLSSIAFCAELEALIGRSNTFFSMDLLKLINKHFGFTDLSVTIYQGHTYLDAFSFYSSLPPDVHQKIRDVYNNNGYQQDPISSYISNNINNLLMGEKTVPIQSKKMGNYIHTRHNALFSFADMQDMVTIPITENYRLSVMQFGGQPPISESDTELLCELGTYLRYRNLAHKKNRQADLISQFQNRSLDENNIGLAIFDNKLRLLSYTSTFVQYFDELFHTTNIAAYAPRVIEDMPESGTKRLQNMKLTFTRNTGLDTGGNIERFSQLTISKATNSDPTICPPEIELPFYALTPREIEVLDLFCIYGKTYPEISKAMYITEGTVKTHLKHIYNKLGVNNQRQLIRKYIIYRYYTNPQMLIGND